MYVSAQGSPGELQSPRSLLGVRHASPVCPALFNMNTQFVQRAQTEPPLSVREVQNTLEIQTPSQEPLLQAGLSKDGRPAMLTLPCTDSLLLQMGVL